MKRVIVTTLICFGLVFSAYAWKTVNGWPVPQNGDSGKSSATNNWAFAAESLWTAQAIILGRNMANPTITPCSVYTSNGINSGKILKIQSKDSTILNHLVMTGNFEKTDDVNIVDFYRSTGRWDSLGPITAYRFPGAGADDFFNIRSWGWDGKNYILTSEIGVSASENWDTTHRGSNFQVYLTPKNTIGMKQCLFVDENGVWASTGDFYNIQASQGFTFVSAQDDALCNIGRFMKARGTYSAPTAVKSGDYLGNIPFYGYDSSGYQVGASISAYTTQDYTKASRGSAVQINAAPNTGGADAAVAIFYGDKTYMANRLGVGRNAPAGCMMEVSHNSDTETGFRIRNSKASDTTAWEFSVGTWHQGQLTIYKQIGQASAARVVMSLSQAGHVTIANNSGNAIAEAVSVLRVDSLMNYADSLTAYTAGMRRGDLYHTNGTVKVMY